MNENCCLHQDALLQLGHIFAYERNFNNQRGHKQLPCRIRHKHAVKTSKTCTPITCTLSPPVGVPEGILPGNKVRKSPSTQPGRKKCCQDTHGRYTHLYGGRGPSSEGTPCGSPGLIVPSKLNPTQRRIPPRASRILQGLECSFYWCYTVHRLQLLVLGKRFVMSYSQKQYLNFLKCCRFGAA